MAGHPNTIAAGICGGLGTLTVYLLNRYAGTHLDAAQGAAIATGYAALVLFVGRRGIKGTLAAVWTGVWKGAPAPPPQP